MSLSYGTRYPPDDDSLEDYRVVVRDAARLLSARREADGEAPPDREWQLLAASRRATRWDGLYSLSSRSDGRLSRYDRRGPPSELTQGELDRLAAGFIEAPSLDRTLPMALEILAPRQDPRIDRAAADAIETVLAFQSAPWWVEPALELLEARLGGSNPRPAAEPESIIDREIEAVSTDSADRRGPSLSREQAAQARWEELKRRAGLRPNRLSAPTREVRGTGGDTPL